MRGARLLLLVVLAATAMTAAFPSTASSAVRYKRCGGGVDVDGAILARPSFYRRIRARKVRCRTARQVIAKFAVRANHDGYIPTSNPHGSFIERFQLSGKGWRCTARWKGPAPFIRARHLAVGCKRRGGYRVRFIGAA